MNKALFVFIILFFFPFAYADAATLSRPVNGLGLVGYWSLNEATSTNAGDFSGYGNAGIASSTWTPGKRGSSLSFNRSTDYAYMPTFNQTMLPATFVAWVKVPSSVTLSTCRGAVFSRGTAVSGMNIGACSASSRLGYHWNNAADTYSWTSGPLVPRDKWFLAALVVESGQATMYAISEDGVASSVNAVAHSSSVIDGLNVGRDPSQSRYFGGQIDEVRIYNRALTQSQLESMYTGGYVRINASRTTVSDGLVSRWTFDGADVSDKVYDRVGGANGYFFGGATSTVMGKIGQALNFDGADDYVGLGTPSAMNVTTDFTFSAWIYPRSFGESNRGRIVDKTGGGNNGFLMFIGGDGICNSRNATLCGDVMGQTARASLGDVITLNAWQFVTMAYTKASNTLAFYVNGVAQGTSAVTGTLTDHSAVAAYIGNNAANARTFDGYIDDPRMYNRLLSAAEIKQLYNEGVGTKVNVNTTNNASLDQGLVGYWSFNGPDITDQVYDRSPYANNGYIYGVATSSAKTIGKVGQALYFDGSNDQVVIAAAFAPSTSFTTLTIGAWVYWDGQVTSGIFHGSSANPIHLEIQSGGVVRARANGADHVTSAGAVTVGRWTHVAFVNTGSLITIYVDGVDVANVAESSGTISVADLVRIGVSCCSGVENLTRPFQGKIDEVRMYNRVLTAAEIKQLYNAGR